MSTAAPPDAGEPGPSRPPVLASIGTVLIDLFEPTVPRDTGGMPLTPSDPASPVAATFSAAVPLDELVPVLGGGALYAVAGARLWLPPTNICTLVDRAPRAAPSDRKGKGVALPDDVLAIVEASMGRLGAEMFHWREGEGLNMPSARIGYNGDVRSYTYVVRPPKRDFASVRGTRLFGAAFLHVGPPFGPRDLLAFLDDMRAQSDWRPRVVFEPWPIACVPAEREAFERVAQEVEVLSPNHEELLAIYGETAADDPATMQAQVERVVRHLLDVGVGHNGNGVVVIRASRSGSCAATRRHGIVWVPAYFDAATQARVKDVTGAGNAFLGAYVAGLQLTGGDPIRAQLYGAVGASFMVEQTGLPSLSVAPSTSGADSKSAPAQNDAAGSEMWNGESPIARVEELRRRCGI